MKFRMSKFSGYLKTKSETWPKPAKNDDKLTVHFFPYMTLPCQHSKIHSVEIGDTSFAHAVRDGFDTRYERSEELCEFAGASRLATLLVDLKRILNGGIIREKISCVFCILKLSTHIG